VVTPAAGLPRSSRLTRPADFARVYAVRRSASVGPLVLYAAKNALPGAPVRLGMSVSRRIGSAVVRNRWKRRLREAYRAVRTALPAGNDLVVVVRSGPPPAGAAGTRQVADWIGSLAARVVARPGHDRTAPVTGGPAPPRRRR
jgi:ribonuclease P protein component